MDSARITARAVSSSISETTDVPGCVSDEDDDDDDVGTEKLFTEMLSSCRFEDEEEELRLESEEEEEESVFPTKAPPFPVSIG